MDIIKNWENIQRLFKKALSSSGHYAIATVTPEGLPHITPIGSLIFLEPGHAFYFEEYPKNLPHNLEENPNVCILAANSGFFFMLTSMIRGRFNSPCAIRLYGTAGPRRVATDREIDLWMKKVKVFKRTKGYKIVWDNMHVVRDLKFTDARCVYFGEMTKDAYALFK